MSGGNPRLAARQDFGRIVVVGGGCYGGYYVRQLRRAVAAGAVRCARIVVVDRDAACPVAARRTAEDPLVDVEIAEWRAYLSRVLGAPAEEGGLGDADAIVPSPLMPHLLRDWLIDSARRRWPTRDVRVEPLIDPPDVPWQRQAPDGTHYVSFATWTCPINCIEPERCPHTRGPRDWSLAPTLRRYAERAGRGMPQPGPYLFRCTHRAYGVGMIDVREILAAEAALAVAGTDGTPLDVIVGTVSHCHGAVSRIVVAAAGSTRATSP